MAVTKTDRIIRMTADDDLYSSGLEALQIVGVRLIAGASAACRAQLRKDSSSGDIVMALAAVTGTSDESNVPMNVDGGTLHLDLSESTGEVYVYLK